MTDPFRLDGRRALVTGANTGIGQAIAVALARAGAEVGCAARGDAEETLAKIAADGGRAHGVTLDLTDPMAGGPVVASGDYDILVNNAGTTRRGLAVDITEEDWDAVLDVNLKAVYFTSTAFARARAGGRGWVVNIASMLSFQGGIKVAPYTASKHGVAGVTRILANEWAPLGINVNAVAPGYVETNNTAPLIADAERYRSILERIPVGHWAKPEEIAEPVVFLCSPAASYVHGAVLNVDGGWLAR